MEKIGKPVKGYAPVTLEFGEMYNGVRHKGIDFGVPEGTPVYAAAAGTVLNAGYEAGGYEHYVILIHSDGTGTVYAKLSRKAVQLGACLAKGGLIGYSGNTGNSSGPHLHFEYRKYASSLASVVDPAQYFEDAGQSVDTTVYAVPQQSRPGLKDDLKIGAAEIVCDVANVRNSSLQKVGTLKKGPAVTLTGDTQDYYGTRFYKALVMREVWIAANDGNTQILDNVD